jgi:hypothetical protein
MTYPLNNLSCGFLDADGHRRIMTNKGVFSCPPISATPSGTLTATIGSVSIQSNELSDVAMGPWVGRFSDPVFDGGCSQGYIMMPVKHFLSGYDTPYGGKVLAAGGYAPGTADDYLLCYTFNPTTNTWTELLARLNHARTTAPFLVFAGAEGIQCIGGGSDVIEQLVYDIDGVTLIWKDVATITNFGNALAVTGIGDGNDLYGVILSADKNLYCYQPSQKAIMAHGTLDLSAYVDDPTFVSIACGPFVPGNEDVLYLSWGTGSEGNLYNWRLLKIVDPQDSRYAVISVIDTVDQVHGASQKRPIIPINYYINYIVKDMDTGVWGSKLYNCLTNELESTIYPIFDHVRGVWIVGRIQDPISQNDVNYFISESSDPMIHSGVAMFTVGDLAQTLP